ncbi:929_t:CDS:2 [Funneliformis geosporum]|uniref:929_t:CDS:1 n=1 Tax=Funneliformis geosporum TaxID=1117311 RepID=A0A9W4WTD2_9GLOM|nr:929_t:CDS:2 [Funneliformis geosporum]
MKSNSAEIENTANSLSKDLKFALDNHLFSDIKLKGNDGEEINAHRIILVSRSEVFRRMLLNEMKESTQEVIEFPEFSSKTLHVILEYLYTEKVTEKTLKIDIIAKAFHSADYFLLEQLKLQIIEFVLHDLKSKENKINISAKVLSQLLECMDTSNNKLVDTLCIIINSAPLKSIEYCNLTDKALNCILSKINREENTIFFKTEYELFHYIILWTANNISEEALLFYNSYLPSPEIIERFIATHMKEWNVHSLSNTEKSHAIYRSTMLSMTSSLLNYVDIGQIHPSIISDIIEPLNGIVDSNILLDTYRKKALLAEKYSNILMRVALLQWDGRARGSKMNFDTSPFIVFTNSSSHEWIRTSLPIIGQGLFEWGIVVEEICCYFWVGICTENGFDVNYNSWLGTQAYGWVLAFSNLPDVVYPSVSLCKPGKARIVSI